MSAALYQPLKANENVLPGQPVIATPNGMSVPTSSGAMRADTFDPTGKYTVKFDGEFAAVEVQVTHADGECSVKTEAGAMISMSEHVDFAAKVEGGFGAACLRSCCAGGSMFFMYFRLHPTAPPSSRGDLLLAPAAPGNTMLLHLAGEEWLLQKGAFLACDAGITIDTRVQSLSKGLFSGAGFFIMSAKGLGRLVVASYGAIVRYDLAPGETRKIDNGYLVAWPASMQYVIGKSSRSLASSFLSSEGFATKFTGPGTVYAQTRALQNLARSLAPYLPANSASSG
eukprot:jgi/Chlat1/1799/Chrsp135S02124